MLDVHLGEDTVRTPQAQRPRKHRNAQAHRPQHRAINRPTKGPHQPTYQGMQMER